VDFDSKPSRFWQYSEQMQKSKKILINAIQDLSFSFLQKPNRILRGLPTFSANLALPSKTKNREISSGMNH